MFNFTPYACQSDMDNRVKVQFEFALWRADGEFGMDIEIFLLSIKIPLQIAAGGAIDKIAEDGQFFGTSIQDEFEVFIHTGGIAAVLIVVRQLQVELNGLIAIDELVDGMGGMWLHN